MAGCQKKAFAHRSWRPIAEHSRIQKIQICKCAKICRKNKWWTQYTEYNKTNEQLAYLLAKRTIIHKFINARTFGIDFSRDGLWPYPEYFLGRVKLLSAAVLFNGIKESWRLARKILFWVLTVIREILTLFAILLLELVKTFLLPAADRKKFEIWEENDSHVSWPRLATVPMHRSNHGVRLYRTRLRASKARDQCVIVFGVRQHLQLTGCAEQLLQEAATGRRWPKARLNKKAVQSQNSQGNRAMPQLFVSV